MSNRLFEFNNCWLVEHPNSPVYHIAYYDPREQRIRRKTTRSKDFEEAKYRLIEFANLRADPDLRDPRIVPLADVFVDYLTLKMKGRPTEYQATLSVRELMTFFDSEGIIFVSQASYDAQHRFVNWRREKAHSKGRAISDATISRDLSVLKAALRHHKKRDRVSGVPEVISLPSSPPRERFLDESECRRLLESCREPHIYRYVMIALHTLQRPAAILRLTIEQVDLSRERIDFRGVGAMPCNKRRAVVPITKTLAPVLRAAIDDSRSGHIIEYHGKPVKSIFKGFRAASLKAGLEGVSPYTLRHTGATLLAAHGVPMRQIAGLLAHTTANTSEIYAKHAPEFLQDAAKTLDRVIGSTS